MVLARRVTLVLMLMLLQAATPLFAQRAKQIRDEDLPYPPTLPEGQAVVRDVSDQFLERPEGIKADVVVAKVAPTIDFLFYPGQDYPGKPWSNWGDGTFANGKYYSAIGDHYSIGRGEAKYGTGTAGVYEYDPDRRELRVLVDVSRLLNLPRGHYTPGKIHSRIDLGSDGWLYYATHRGSSRAANDENHYVGDWILRTNPETGVSEVVVQAPIPKHSIPNSVLDAKRMIFYGGTAAGPDATDQDIQFFAYDLREKKLLYAGPDGPARYMMLASSSGKLFYVPGNDEGEVMCFDPNVASSGKTLAPRATGVTMGIRAATNETSDHLIYSVSTGQGSTEAAIWEFNTVTEQARKIGTAAVGANAYVASIDVDPTGRFLYYVPGAHGGGPQDGSPVVQFEIATGRKKVIAFLHPYYEQKYGFVPKGTYSTALSSDGSELFVTWNVSRGTRAWDCCGLSVIHIPEQER
jgi:hypothetical protein